MVQSALSLRPPPPSVYDRAAEGGAAYRAPGRTAQNERSVEVLTGVTEPTPSRSPLGALRYPEYRWFFVGCASANVGQWMFQFTLGWLTIEIAIREGDPSRGPLYLGLVGAARLLPALVFGLIGGVLADRFDRRRMLLWTRTTLALVVAATAVLVLSGSVTIRNILVLAALFALVSAIDVPVRLAISPMLTPPADALSAISITRSTMQASAIVGPLVGGLLIGPLGTGSLLVLNAELYAISGLGSGRLRPLPAMVAAGGVSPLDSLLEGLRYVGARPALRAFLTANAIFAVFANSYPQLLPAVAHDTLGGGALELSWLAAGSGVGALLGSFFLTTIGSWRKPGWVLIAHAAGAGIALIVFGMQRTAGPAVAVTAVLGWLSIVYTGGTGTVLQIHSANEFRGRILGLHATIFLVGVQLGTLVLGVAGSLTSVAQAEMLAGVAILIVAIGISRVAAVRGLEAWPPPEPHAASTTDSSRTGAR